MEVKVHCPQEGQGGVDIILITNSGERVAERIWYPARSSEDYLWPSTWLLKDINSSVRVIEVKYEIATWEWTELASPLFYHSVKAILLLEEYLANSNHPIVFLSYGFGGFLVKQIIQVLKNGPPKYAKIFLRVMGIIFYGVPHKTEFSLQLQDLVRSSPQLIFPDPPRVALEAICPYLLYLSDQMLSLDHIQCLSFVEMQNSEHKVVPLSAAQFGKGSLYILPTCNYSQLTRPASREDFGYIATTAFIKSCINSGKLLQIPFLLRLSVNQRNQTFSIWLRGRFMQLVAGTEQLEITCQNVIASAEYSSLFIVLTQCLHDIKRFLQTSVQDLIRSVQHGEVTIQVHAEKREGKLARMFLAHSLALLPSQLPRIPLKEIDDLVCPYDLVGKDAFAMDTEKLLTLCTDLNIALKNIGADSPTIGQLLESLRGSIARPTKVVIIGRPNAGKSTLLNSFLGKNVLPVGTVECTAVPIEIAENTEGNKDHKDPPDNTEIIYKSKQECADKLNELKVKLSDQKDKLKVLKHDEHNLNQAKISDLQDKITAAEEDLKALEEAVRNIPETGNEKINGIDLHKVQHGSNFGRVVACAKVLMSKPILKKFTFVDTPGLTNHLDTNEQVLRVLQDDTLDGWIYLSCFDYAEAALLHQDIHAIHKYANGIPGMCVISKFDSCTDQGRLDDILAPKRKVIHLANAGKNAPACSAYIMTQIAQTPSLKDLASEADKLPLQHVGQYFFAEGQVIVAPKKAEVEEEIDLDNLGQENTALSEANMPFTLKYACEKQPSLIKDIATENSMFVPLLHDIQRMVTKTVRTENVANALEQMKGIVVPKLLQLEKDIYDTERIYVAYTDVDKKKQILAEQRMRVGRLQQQVTQAKLDYEQMRRDMVKAMKQLQVQLDTFANDSFLAERVDKIMQIVAEKRGIFSTKSTPFKLYDHFDQEVMQEAESCIQQSVDASILRKLLAAFPGLIHTAELLAQSLTSRINCAVGPSTIDITRPIMGTVFYSERFTEKKTHAAEKFKTLLCARARGNIRIIIENAEQHLAYVYTRIIALVDEDIRRLKTQYTKESARTKELEDVQNGSLNLVEPANIVQIKLSVLKFQHSLLSTLHSKFNDFYLPLTLAAHYFPEFNDYGTLLSRREQKYLRGIYDLYKHRGIVMTRGSVVAPSAKLPKAQEVILEALNGYLLKEDSKAAQFKDVKDQLQALEQIIVRAIVVQDRRIGILAKEGNLFVFKPPFYSQEVFTDISKLNSPEVIMILMQ